MKYIFHILIPAFFIHQTRAQNPNQSDMYLGYNTDLFVSPSFKMGHGFRLGYRFKLENNITFLQLNAMGSFGKGTGARILIDEPLYNFFEVVDADYEFAHMSFYFS